MPRCTSKNALQCNILGSHSRNQGGMFLHHSVCRTEKSNFSERWVHMYWVGLKGLNVLLSRTQAGPGRAVKQEQVEISRNHVQTFIYLSVHSWFKSQISKISETRHSPSSSEHIVHTPFCKITTNSARFALGRASAVFRILKVCEQKMSAAPILS